MLGIAKQWVAAFVEGETSVEGFIGNSFEYDKFYLLRNCVIYEVNSFFQIFPKITLLNFLHRPIELMQSVRIATEFLLHRPRFLGNPKIPQQIIEVHRFDGCEARVKGGLLFLLNVNKLTLLLLEESADLELF
jgi:hypothetical protein